LTQTSILPGEILKSESLFLKKHALLKQLLLSQEELLFFEKILASSQETFVFLSRYFRYFEIHSCLLKKFLFFSQDESGMNPRFTSPTSAFSIKESSIYGISRVCSVTILCRHYFKFSE